VEPALHAHIVPRYAWERPETRRTPVWLHDRNSANAFNIDRDAELLQRLAAALKSALEVTSEDTSLPAPATLIG
jgi:hypothetical protein